MSAQKITATEASRSFSDILNRVKYAGEEFLVGKGGVPFCRIVPVERRPPMTIADLARLIAVCGVDAKFAADVEEGINVGNTPVIPKDP